MNVREEDRKKNSCPSHGLGLAAAAIGVGVGAALYYFFSKRTENPDGEGSTSRWSCEEPHAFDPMHDYEETDSYTTISENSTSDTSMYTSDESEIEINETLNEETSSEDATGIFSWWNCRGSSTSFTTDSDDTSSDTSYSVNANSTNINGEDTFETGNFESVPAINATYIGSDPDTLDWDVTDTSMGVPDGSTSPRTPLMSLLSNIGTFVSPRAYVSSRSPLSRRITEDEQLMIRRDQAFRERTWSLEECSICFDVILKDHQITTLPCTHHFHTSCIAPWLQEQQTCPNCRKAAE